MRERERKRERERNRSRFDDTKLLRYRTLNPPFFFAPKTSFSLPTFFPKTSQTRSPLYPSQICAFKLKRRKRERERDDRRSSEYVLNNAKTHDLRFASYIYTHRRREGCILKTCLRVKMPSSRGASSWRHKHHLRRRDERTRCTSSGIREEDTAKTRGHRRSLSRTWRNHRQTRRYQTFAWKNPR